MAPKVMTYHNIWCLMDGTMYAATRLSTRLLVHAGLSTRYDATARVYGHALVRALVLGASVNTWTKQ